MNNKNIDMAADKIVDWWPAVLVISIIAVVLAAMGLPRLYIDVNSESLFDDDYTPMIDHRQIQEDFTEGTNIAIAIRTKPSTEQVKDTIFTPGNLSVIQQLTDAAWQLPYSSRVNSLTNHQYTQALEDDLLVGDLLPADKTLNKATIAEVRRVSFSEPALYNQMISPSGNLATVNVDFEKPDDLDRALFVSEVVDATHHLIQPFQANYPNLEFLVSGTVSIENATRKYTSKDYVTLIPLMLLTMIAMLVVLLRSVWGTICVVVVVVASCVAAMGIVGWLGIDLDILTAVAPMVIMALAVADAVHVQIGVANGMRKGMTQNAAIRYSLKLNAWPVFFTSITTIFGVITFAFTDYPTLRKLGIVISIGVATAFTLTLTLLPAMLVKVKLRYSKSTAQSQFFERLANGVIRQHRIILPAAALVCGALAFMAGQNSLDESVEKFFKHSTIERQAVSVFNEELGGSMRMDMAISTNKPGEISEPEFLKIVSDLTDWLRQQQAVSHVTSITDTFKRLNQNMHGDDPDWYKLPITREMAAQYLLLYELSLPYGMHLSNQINLDKSATRLYVTIGNTDGKQIVAIKNNAVAWLEQRNPDLKLTAGGMAYIMPELAITRLMPGLLRGGMVSILMVALVLFVVLRNWKYGMAAILANILPIAMGYGVWSQISGLANLAVVSVAGVCLGVVVDFAVHFLSKYKSARLTGMDAEDAIRYAFDKVGLPLVTTAVVLVCGFWILMLSEISLNSNLGTLTGIIILLTLAFDFLVLPALLLTFDRKKMVAEPAPPDNNLQSIAPVHGGIIDHTAAESATDTQRQ